MEGPGERLKNLRLEKGLTLQDVSKQTKVHLSILKAIEEDSLVGLNPVYIKGFVKIYCRFLGVDPKDYLAGYSQPQRTVKIVSEFPSARGRTQEFFKATLVKLRSFQVIKIKPVLIVVTVILVAFVLFNLGKLISGKRAKQPISVAAELAQKTDKVAPSKTQRQEPPKPKKETPLFIRLGLRAKDDSRITVKVDGKLVFTNVLKKGKFESWLAKDNIEFTLGNAGVVEVELDGRAMPSLGRRGQAIKNIRITKNEGLVVPR